MTNVDALLWRYPRKRASQWLYDLRFLSGIATVVASGVGGGSLVYANIHVRPDAGTRHCPGRAFKPGELKAGTSLLTGSEIADIAYTRMYRRGTFLPSRPVANGSLAATCWGITYPALGGFPVASSATPVYRWRGHARRVISWGALIEGIQCASGRRGKRWLSISIQSPKGGLP